MYTDNIDFPWDTEATKSDIDKDLFTISQCIRNIVSYSDNRLLSLAYSELEKKTGGVHLKTEVNDDIVKRLQRILITKEQHKLRKNIDIKTKFLQRNVLDKKYCSKQSEYSTSFSTGIIDEISDFSEYDLVSDAQESKSYHEQSYSLLCLPFADRKETVPDLSGHSASVVINSESEIYSGMHKNKKFESAYTASSPVSIVGCLPDSRGTDKVNAVWNIECSDRSTAKFASQYIKKGYSSPQCECEGAVRTFSNEPTTITFATSSSEEISSRIGLDNVSFECSITSISSMGTLVSEDNEGREGIGHKSDEEFDRWIESIYEYTDFSVDNKIDDKRTKQLNPAEFASNNSICNNRYKLNKYVTVSECDNEFEKTHDSDSLSDILNDITNDGAMCEVPSTFFPSINCTELNEFAKCIDDSSTSGSEII